MDTKEIIEILSPHLKKNRVAELVANDILEVIEAKSKEGYIEACKMIPEDYEEYEMAMIHIDYLHAMLMVSAGVGKEVPDGDVQ